MGSSSGHHKQPQHISWKPLQYFGGTEKQLKQNWNILVSREDNKWECFALIWVGTLFLRITGRRSISQHSFRWHFFLFFFLQRGRRPSHIHTTQASIWEGNRVTFSWLISLNGRTTLKKISNIIFAALHLFSSVNKQSMALCSSEGATGLIGAGLIISGWSAVRGRTETEWLLAELAGGKTAIIKLNFVASQKACLICNEWSDKRGK